MKKTSIEDAIVNDILSEFRCGLGTESKRTNSLRRV